MLKALARGSLLLTAPAGYGKTTVLADALASGPGNAAWLSCAPDSRDAAELVNRLVSAVDEAVPGAAGALGEIIPASQEHVDPIVAAGALMAELDRILVDRVVIVVDDAEHLAESAEACAVLAELLRAESALARVAVASRRRLDVPLAKLRAAGRVDELSAGDLAFTTAEIADLVVRARGVAPDEEEVGELLMATEGWPMGAAALVVAGARSTAGSPHQRESICSPVDLQAVLADEVLGPLDPRSRGWLLDSAVPRYLTPSIVAALGLPDGFLGDARTRGLFLQTEAGSERLTYHPLLRQLLLDRLEAERGSDYVVGLHRRSAAAAADAGSLVDAIEHWRLADDWQRVGAVLATQGRALAAQSPDLVRSWIESLPPSVRSRPSIEALAGHLEWQAGNYDGAIALLRSAISADQLADDPETDWSARLVLVDALSVTGDPASTVTVAEGFDGPGAQPAGMLATATALYAAHSLTAIGRSRDGHRLARRVRQQPEHALAAPIEVMRRAYIDIPAGRLVEIEQQGAAVLPTLERDDPMQLRFKVMSVLAFATAEQGRLEDALRWWRRIAFEADALVLTGIAGAAKGFQAVLDAQLGHIDEAEKNLGAHRAVRSWIGYPHHLARAVLGAARNQREQAVDGAEAALDCARTAPPLFRSWVAAEVVPVLTEVGARQRAESVLAEAEALVGAVFPARRGRWLAVRLRSVRAWMAATMAGDDAAALEVKRLLADAGDAAPFVLRREWDRLAPLVSHALARGVLDVGTTMRQITEAFPDGRALVPLIQHPNPAVRRAALAPALASGHPVAARRATSLFNDPDPSVSRAARAAVRAAGADPPPRVFTMLGEFAVRRGAFRINGRDWARPVDGRLLQFLLVRKGVPAPEDVLFEALWPDLSPAGARRSLQVATSRLRGLLDCPGTAESVVEHTHGAYRLRLGPADVVDSEEFEMAARAALTSPLPARQPLEHARSLWGGEPLPRERYADWATAWRQRLTERYLEVLAALVDCYGREGDHAAAIVAAREMVELDPLDESARRELMAAYARAGRRAQALREYLECRRALVGELGVEPAEATVRLQGAILAGEEV